MTRKAIFIGGTFYSGSIFLDMTLGNDPLGFSLREVVAFFNPWRPRHANPLCSCGDNSCNIWLKLRNIWPENVYAKIFEHFPELTFIVDSSKDPLWINKQAAAAARYGFETRHILIWKTPLEFAHSFQKRNKTGSWQRHWINHHRMYMTLVRTWGGLQYRHYAEDQDSLAEICNPLDIPYFPSKERFWAKSHHLFFDNDSARIHLDDHEGAIQNIEGLYQKSRSAPRKSIVYRPINDSLLEQYVAHVTSNSRRLRDILNVLESRDISRPLPKPKNKQVDRLLASLYMSSVSIDIRRAKSFVQNLVGPARRVGLPVRVRSRS